MDHHVQFDYFDYPNFESVIPPEKLILENKTKLTKYENSQEDMNPEDSKIIIDFIFSKHENISDFLNVLKKIDFNKTHRYIFTEEVFQSDIKYRHTYGNKFISPFIKLSSFKAFKIALDFIFQNYSIDIIIFMLDYGFLVDLKQCYCEPKTSYSTFNCPNFEKFKEYFDYFESIGLFNSIVFVRDLYILFANRNLMFSNDFEKKIFQYVLERVESFKIFFSKIPIYEIPKYIDYIKLAYSYGLDINSEIINKSIYSIYKRNNILNPEILKFLYLAGRNAINDLLLLIYDSGALVYSLEENKPSDFTKLINILKNHKDEYKERIPYLDNYLGVKIEMDYIINKNKIDSLNIILDFARLSNHFPQRLRLTENFLRKTHSIHSKDFICIVKDRLSPILSDSIIDIILSY
jgi:hypothetical protein